MTTTEEKPKIELSEEAHQLLVELCEPYGSSSEALKNPNFVLVELLKALNERKQNVSSCTTNALDWGISKGHLNRLLREATRQKQPRAA